MKGFNLSDWALEHRSFIWYFMILSLVVGVGAYLGLGREEDPSFTIRTMVVSAQWPGASAEEVADQVTERIERQLLDLDSLDYTRSITTAGRTSVYVNLRDGVKSSEVPSTWLRVREMIGDVVPYLPSGVQGPYYNDRFGDVYGNVYAFTADGLSHRQLRDYVEDVRSQLLTVANAGSAQIIGAQDEVIYLNFSTRELSALGISGQQVMATLRDQNAVSSSGVVEAGPERVAVRVGGQFTSEDSLRDLNVRVGDRFFRMADVATITRGYQDPPSALFRFNGEPAIGLAIGMREGANLLEFGAALEKKLTDIEADLPIGIEVHLAADQPVVVEHAVSEFITALYEAVAIVLVVGFLSLGVRAGLVVALSIPLVLAITFLVMAYTGISLQRVSLGALIIALGLLVDDAMIAVEMMVARLEAGDTLRKAATAVYTHTAFPMLTGTVVTVAGFIPIGLNSSSAGEYTYTLFVVLAAALLISWVVAVLFTPLIGFTVLPKALKKHQEGEGLLMRGFSSVLAFCLRWRWPTIGVTLLAFLASIYGLTRVEQQFFPDSDRPELVIDWNLPQNSSIAETGAQMAQFEEDVLKSNADIVRWTSHVGEGAPRFVLTLEGPTAMPSAGQMVIVTRGIEVRDEVKAELDAYLRKTFPGTNTNIKTIALGPPVGRPIQYRVSGPDIQVLRSEAQKLAAVMRQHPNIGDVSFDWMEPSRIVEVNVLQDKARQLGISNGTISNALRSVTSGVTITQIQDSIYLVNVVGRAEDSERGSLETLQNLQLSANNGQAIPLAAIATLGYSLEQPMIIRRDQVPTLTVSASVFGGVQPASVSSELRPAVTAFTDALRRGYQVEEGGTAESSAQSTAPIVAVIPLMLFVMATVLMTQLQSFSRLFLVASVAPLALIGVVAVLLITGRPLGFVAILGVLALIGILIRNSVILIVQIEELRAEGKHPWEAVVEATLHRVRPILLTALAASLALIPIASEVFWGPMAVAMMGGIVVGTALTLIFLPALYIIWFRLSPPAGELEA